MRIRLLAYFALDDFPVILNSPVIHLLFFLFCRHPFFETADMKQSLCSFAFAGVDQGVVITDHFVQKTDSTRRYFRPIVYVDLVVHVFFLFLDEMNRIWRHRKGVLLRVFRKRVLLWADFKFFDFDLHTTYFDDVSNMNLLSGSFGSFVLRSRFVRI